MSNIQPVTPTRHLSARWRRPIGYQFAASDSVCPLVAQELPKAILSLPTGFIKNDDNYSLVAIQGLEPGQNLMVGDNGRWTGKYIPAPYRGYPFVLAEGPDHQQILCIDDSCGLITNEPNGEHFFTDDSMPSQSITEIFRFLTEVYRNRRVTQQIISKLQAHDLIQPWRLKLDRDGRMQVIEGLYRIDEERFNALAAEQLQELREAGCLSVIYCQLISMQHMKGLAMLLQTKAKGGAVKVEEAPIELNLDFLKNYGSISFENL